MHLAGQGWNPLISNGRPPSRGEAAVAENHRRAGVAPPAG